MEDVKGINLDQFNGKEEVIFKYKADGTAEGQFETEQLAQGDPCTNPCSRLANFCCISEVPDGLTLSTTDDFRIVYDPTRIKCCVEECTATTITPTGCANITVPIYAVRLIGCMPISISVLSFKSVCGYNLVPTITRDNRVALCCSETLCVDNVICYRGTLAEAEAACAAIRGALAADPCNTVTLAAIAGSVFTLNFGVCGDRPRILAFTGAFLLPPCPTL